MPTEDELRKRVMKRIEERNEFYGHLAAYIGVNLMLWTIWAFAGADFDSIWPMWVSLFWGMGIVGHWWSYYSEHGAGRERREAAIQREVEREKERLGYYDEKPKNDERHYVLGEDGELIPEDEITRRSR